MSPYYLSYPIKRSASEQTGDTFLIKCIEYTPPKPVIWVWESVQK